MKAWHLAGVEACGAAGLARSSRDPESQGELARAQLANLLEQSVLIIAYTKDQRSQFKLMAT